MKNPLKDLMKKDSVPVAVVENVAPDDAAALNESFRTQWAMDMGGGDRLSTVVLGALDRAVGIQSSTIVKYVEGVKKRRPAGTYEERQKDIDTHFVNIVTGTGAAAGGAAAVPGIGFVTGAAAVAGESAVFLEAATWYILASASLRGIDIRDKELRRALVLLVLSGSKGNAIVDTFFTEQGQLTEAASVGSLASVATLSRFSAPTLQGLNARLAKTFAKQVTKRFKWAWVSKLMPLGIGAVVGGIANRKLARVVMDNAHAQLDELGS